MNQMCVKPTYPLQSDHWHFIDDGPLFDNLESCIDHYMLFPDGLPTRLRHPVSPSGKSMTTPARKVRLCLWWGMG